jgi:hypothetical protein
MNKLFITPARNFIKQAQTSDPAAAQAQTVNTNIGNTPLNPNTVIDTSQRPANVISAQQQQQLNQAMLYFLQNIETLRKQQSPQIQTLNKIIAYIPKMKVMMSNLQNLDAQSAQTLLNVFFHANQMVANLTKNEFMDIKQIENIKNEITKFEPALKQVFKSQVPTQKGWKTNWFGNTTPQARAASLDYSSGSSFKVIKNG